MENAATVLKKHLTPACLVLVTLVSYFTYFVNYQNPQAFFWDENYHIASAQKYLNGVFFMEPHPPLGKLLIAAGEALLHQNDRNDQFVDTDYAQNPPDGFSFTGYRFFPALLAWLTAPLLFLVFLRITQHPIWSMLLTSPYVFDTAQIVHGRGAMLEPTMLFFALVALLGIVLLGHQPDRRTVQWGAVLFGAGFACALATKVFSLILVLLVPAAVAMLWKRRSLLLRFLAVALVSFVVPYVAIWQVHFSLGTTVLPALPDEGYYQASDAFKAILEQGATNDPRHFPVMLTDSLRFVGHYQRGVPRLDLCKSDENGSPWFLWPVGGRTINYRWSTAGGSAYRYLTLVANPAGWLLALMAVVLAGALVLGELLMGGKRLRNRTLLLALLALYCGFLAAVSQIDRVMYLYHYFMPLTFAWVLLGVVVSEVQQFGRFPLTPERKTWVLIGCTVLVFAGFQAYRPFAYYEPMLDTQVEERNVVDVWELRCARCALQSPLVVRPGS